MKLKINDILPEHTVSKHSDKDLYISDYKHFKNYYGYDKYDGKVVILNSKSNEWKSVYLSNQNQVDVNFDGFEENALPIAKGLYNSQCECVLFPDFIIANKRRKKVQRQRSKPKFSGTSLRPSRRCQTYAFFANLHTFVNNDRKVLKEKDHIYYMGTKQKVHLTD